MKLFDLHCDTLCALHGSWRESASGTQFDLAALPPDRCGCQTFAIFVPDTLRGAGALDYFRSVYRYAKQYFAVHSGRLTQVRCADEIDAAAQDGKIGALLAVENAAALGGDPAHIAEFAAAGVRLMTLTWNAANELGGGAQSDAGLTALGRETLAEMEQNDIVLDVSHLNDKTFWQAAEAATRPFIASHSNSRAVCRHPRNLTDDQFRAVVQSGGIVGLNFYAPFLSEQKTACFDDLLRQIWHLLECGGEHALALGSDFDGADMPDFVKDAAALDFVYQCMIKSSLGKNLTDAIFYRNADAFFRRMEEAFR